MTVPWQIAGGDLFSYLGMGRRMNGNDVINLSNCSESLLLLLFFGLFSHEESNWLLEFTRSMTTFNTL
jgi:hypothetical protein